MTRHREKPTRRTNPSGKTVFVARYTAPDGRRRSAGTYRLQGPCHNPQHDDTGSATCCAQHAIDAAYTTTAPAPRGALTVREYAQTWLHEHPRTARTAKNYDTALRSVLDAELHGKVFGDLPVTEVRRKHAKALIGVLLADHGRSIGGARMVFGVVRAMFTDALDDEKAEHNPFHGIRLSARDPRIRKATRRPSIWAWDEMHAFARAAGAATTERSVVYFTEHGRERRNETRVEHEVVQWRRVYAEAMIRTLSDCGLRIGECLALERRDVKGDGRCDEPPCLCAVPHLHVRRTAFNGAVKDGTKNSLERVAVVPDALGALLTALPSRIDTRLLFPSMHGRVWQEHQFYSLVWNPARAATGMQTTPHDFRHSYVSLLRAAGVDARDLAARTGHTEETATRHYTHPLGRSDDAIRRAVDEGS